ncbi:MFS transporter [Candidatus Thorarchaeota archaeon]|nr:MAG: MFS transporter [Candidatus Thorarchaeota archaeon]
MLELELIVRLAAQEFQGAADLLEESPENTNEPKLPAKAFVVGALTQFALGLHAPFLQTYLVDMQNYLYGVKNFAELGAFRSVGNVAPTVLQPIWGGASDKVGHTRAFVAFGTMMGLIFVYLFLWAATPIDLIILYVIQSILFSIQIPTWLSLMGGLMGEKNRGDELGKLGLITNISSFVATLASGALAVLPSLLPWNGEPWREDFYLPFLLTAIFGIVSSLLSLTIKEKSRTDDKPRKFPPMHRLLSQPSDFRKFSFVAVFFSFSMSMAWPFFIVVQRDWLGATLLEIAIASAVMTLSTIIFTIPFGRLSDRVGRKPLILLGRMLLFVVPITYAFAWEMWMVYLANFIAGFTTAASMNAITAYIYDVAPEDERGSHIAVFNTFTGIVYTLGSFLAGIFGQLILITLGSEYLSVFIMLIVSGILRFIAAFFYLLIEEPKQYSSTLRLEFKALVHRRRHDIDTV